MTPPNAQHAQLAPSVSIDPVEFDRCIEILEAVVRDRGLIATLPDDKRLALLIAAGRVSHPERNELRKMSKTFRREQARLSQERDRVARAATEIRAARRNSVFVAPPRQLPPLGEGPERVLTQPRSCYVCKTSFTRLHFFYDSMCAPCAELNYEKRFQTTKLDGRVALITGARLKIGYHAALKMLRAGATVIATTRFPHDSAERYALEPDYDEWKGRLHIFGLDLRHAPSVELFARHLEESFDRLDFLVNNAAQTVRRPPGFYSHLLEREEAPVARLSAAAQPLLAGFEALKARLSGAKSLPRAPAVDHLGLAAWKGAGAGIGVRASARLSQLPYAYDESEQGMDSFPRGELDVDLQQVDLRMTNSWRLTLGEVPTPEMLEVQLVNAVAPFILCSKLKPLMLRHPTGDKHIVNVTAMEGIFSRGTKTDKHPHTNMAKAALNMMTLTSAPDYANDGIFMNAVDTGWVTDEDPAAHVARKQAWHDFQPPLDIVDGAARVCDPFFVGLNTGEHVFGKFLKDYRPAAW
jgi:NAD(P)-dependent dehydrogenase (short-subunit alcohol dehydrogenase family)